MRLRSRELSGWPPLTWVAVVREGRGEVELLHGPAVEVAGNWAVEGVWAGAFAQGGFDRTSLVFGSGVRCREGHATFVSSGSNVDRLWHLEDEGDHTVANSLPALLVVAETRLMDRVPDYAGRLGSFVLTAGKGTVPVPSRDGPLECVYFRNLRWDGRELREQPKPGDAPPFEAFEVYRDFLLGAGRDIGANATSEDRGRPFSLLTTVTSGYDSSAASVVAREAGCRRAATIRRARATVPRSDSGDEVARALELECTVHPRSGRSHPLEQTFWAATGNVQDANLAVLDYPDPPCLLFSGAFGGPVWTMDVNDLGLGLRPGDFNTLGLCEFRLWKGVVHLPVPFCGARRAWELFELTHSDAMEPWVLGEGYDRPIPRRIAEEAGVPREAFGRRKSATQFEESFRWPRRADLQESYRRYLEERGQGAPPVRLCRALDRLEQNVLFPLRERLLRGATPARIRPSASRLLFQWANHELAADLASTDDAPEHLSSA